jgi:sugar-specific transcriptional regulator TrmB
MNQEHATFLQGTGLTATESKAYLALLENGESLAGAVAKKSGLYRKNTYDALESLAVKGFVTSHTRKGRKHWQAVTPEKIKQLFQEKLDYANTILPQLISKFNKVKPSGSVEVFQDVEGMKSFNDIILREGKTLYVVGATGRIFKRLRFSIPTYVELLSQKNLKSFFLINSDADETGIKQLNQQKGVNLRRMPPNFSTPTQLYLFGDYSGIIIWSEEPIAILIKSQEIAKGFKAYFDFIWAQSKQI